MDIARHGGRRSSFRYDFEGRGIGLLITSGPDAGVIEFSIDGGDFRELDRITRWSRCRHLPWALILAYDLSDARALVVRTNDKAEGRMTPGSGTNRRSLTGQNVHAFKRSKKYFKNELQQ